MKWIWAAVVLLCVFLGAVLVHRAQAIDYSSQMQRALDWIAQNSDYKNIQAPQSYEVLNLEALRSRAVGTPNVVTANAFHDCSSRTFFVGDTFDPRSTWDMSVLVHEMTHHAQCTTHGSISNTCDSEREAYQLQMRYLETEATANRERLPETKRRFDEIVQTICRISRGSKSP